MQEYSESPIVRTVNPHTKAVWDDSGYDTLPVVESKEPMVELGEYSEKTGPRVEAYPAYDGFNYYTGERNGTQGLPGGIGTTGTYIRQSVAEGLIASDRFMRDQLGMNLVVVDGFRTAGRAEAGFVKTAIDLNCPDAENVEAFYRVAKTAKGFFSPVGLDTESKGYQETYKDLMETPRYAQAFEVLATEFQTTAEEIAATYIKFCTAIRYCAEKFPEDFPKLPSTPLNVLIPLSYDNSTHPTGGSVDMLIKNEGVIATPAGFDCFEPEGGMDPLENMTFEDLQKRYVEHPTLRIHCKSQFGIDPEQLQSRHYNLMKRALRVLFHVTDRSGATHYLDEFQHKQWGNIVRNPANRNQVIYRGRSANIFPEAGNSCHSIQTMMHSRAVAIYGGLFAEMDVLEKFGKDRREV